MNTRTNMPLILFFLAMIVLRVGGIDYGLPLDLVPGESNLIIGALAIAQERSITGLWNPDGGLYVYAMNVVPIVFLFVLTPVVLIYYLLSDFSSFIDFTYHLKSDLTLIVLTLRILTALVGSISAVIFYKLSERLFGATYAWFPTILYGLCFTGVLWAHFARYWTYSSLILVLVPTITLLWKTNRIRALLIGLLCGIGFGINFVGIWSGLLFIGAYSWKNKLAFSQILFDRNIWAMMIACAVTILLVVLTNYSYFEWIFETIDNQNRFLTHRPKSLFGFMDYALTMGGSLLKHDPIIFIYTIIGIAALLRKCKWKFLLWFAIYCLTYTAFMYLSVNLESYYILPLIPVICTVAGLGIIQVVRILKNWSRIAPIIVVFASFALQIAPVIQADRLLSRDDTRLIASKWIEENLGKEILFIETGTQGIWVRKNATALALAEKYGTLDPRDKRDKVLKDSGRSLVRGNNGVYAFRINDPLDTVEMENFVSLILREIQPSQDYYYHVMTHGGSPQGLSKKSRKLLESGDLVKYWTPKVESLRLGHDLKQSVVGILRADRLGPTIKIYKLPII